MQFNQTCIGFHFGGNIGKKDAPEPVEPKKKGKKKPKEDIGSKRNSMEMDEIKKYEGEKASFVDS